MSGHSARTAREILAALAAPEQPAAAGVAAALTAAGAAAVVEMCATRAAEIASEGEDAAAAKRMTELGLRVAGHRGRLLALADEDVAVYGDVRAAVDERTRAAALGLAAEPPLQIAELAAGVAETALEASRAGADRAWGYDATVAAGLAAAACSGAALLVAADLPGRQDDPRIARARAAAKRAGAAAAAARAE